MLYTGSTGSHTQKKTFPGPIHNNVMDLWETQIDPLVALNMWAKHIQVSMSHISVQTIKSYVNCP